MKTLNAVLALALAAVPAGAIELGLSAIPEGGPRVAVTPAAVLQLPVSTIMGPQAGLGLAPAALGLPASAAIPSAAAVVPAMTDVSVKTAPFAMTSLQTMGAINPAKSAGVAADVHRFNVGFDGSKEKLMAAPVQGGGSGSSNNGGGSAGAGNSGSGSGGNSGSGGVLAGLVARIEATGQVRANRKTGDAVKMIAPKVEKTPNGQTQYIVALTGKVDAKGTFTKDGIVAAKVGQQVIDQPLSATRRHVQELDTVVEVKAALDGKAATVASVKKDHTDIIENISYDPQAKQADFQAELANAERILKVSGLKAVMDEVMKRVQADLMAMLQGGVLTLEETQAKDGTVNRLLAVVTGDDQGQPNGIVLVRTSEKGVPNPNGQGDTARQEQTVYRADAAGKVVEASFMGKDHTLDLQQTQKAADPAAQGEFDAIVAKVAKP